VNAKVGIRRTLFGVFALNWIMKSNPMKSLSYIVAHHMFEKSFVFVFVEFIV